CRPRAQIVPAEACRYAVDTGLAFTLGRARLQDRVVHADVFACWIKLGEGLVELAGTVTLGDLLQDGSRLGQLLSPRVPAGCRSPDEHAAVPEVVPGLHELLGDVGRRFLGEAFNLQNTLLRLNARFDVAIAGLSPRRLDSDDNDIRVSRCNLRGAPNVFMKA